jgi:hypothetical protein
VSTISCINYGLLWYLCKIECLCLVIADNDEEVDTDDEDNQSMRSDVEPDSDEDVDLEEPAVTEVHSPELGKYTSSHVYLADLFWLKGGTVTVTDFFRFGYGYSFDFSRYSSVTIFSVIGRLGVAEIENCSGLS